MTATVASEHSWAKPGSFYTLSPLDVPGFPARRAFVYVPSGPTPVHERPVLYLFDGQNVWTDHGSYAGGWYAHQAAERLNRSRKHFVAPVVVGLEHGGESRINELSAWPVMGQRGGGAERFFDWMVGKFLPHLQRHFGLRGGPLHTVLGGSSIGGLAALYGHYRHPDVFGGALCMSPSLFVGGRAIFRLISEKPRPLFSRVYIDCGGLEGKGRMLALAQDMAKLLEGKGYPADQLMWRPDTKAGHNERAWRRRLPKALRFMFRR